MKKIAFFLSLCFAAYVAEAQKYGNVWQFGLNSGLDFNDCDPVLVPGRNSGPEGCSSIADSSGMLLFYTNSDSVWNRLHEAMPGGFLNSSGGTISQVIIIPRPQTPGRYYVVTTKVQAAGALRLEYHEVDMSLNGGLGDVIEKNQLLSSLNVTEQVAATYHSNGTDVWLAAHEYGTGDFLIFPVTSAGISTAPVVSTAGPAHVSCTSNMNARGEMKFSPDGNKLAFTGNGTGGNDPSNMLVLCDFDKNSGIVYNPLNLPCSRGEFGLSFSPDNQKLYAATWKAFNFSLGEYNYLYQFDLSSGVPATIIGSKRILDSIQNPKSYGSLKAGPDGKIYVRHFQSDYLGVIHAPNLAGPACSYVAEGFYLGNKTYQSGLNNYIEYTEYCQASTGVATYPGQDAGIVIFPNPFSNQLTLASGLPLNDATVTFYNSIGQRVSVVKNLSGKQNVILRGDLLPGLYYVQITHNGTTIAIKNLVISD